MKANSRLQNLRNMRVANTDWLLKPLLARLFLASIISELLTQDRKVKLKSELLFYIDVLDKWSTRIVLEL